MGFLLQVSAFLLLFLGQEKPQIDKKEFYHVFSSSDDKVIIRYESLLKNSTIKEQEAYLGALLMKKAGIVGNPKDKLSFFKQGAKKLESAISKEKQNAEYRFLRLMIQENAPSILGYKSNLKEDSELIRASFKHLEPAVQHVIVDYSKDSKVLHPEDFQF